MKLIVIALILGIALVSANGYKRKEDQFDLEDSNSISDENNQLIYDENSDDFFITKLEETLALLKAENEESFENFEGKKGKKGKKNKGKKKKKKCKDKKCAKKCAKTKKEGKCENGQCKCTDPHPDPGPDDYFYF